MMVDLWTIIAAAGLAVWIGLALFRGNFWRADQRLGDTAAPTAWPAVVAVIPARNKAPTIHRVVASLLAQDYPGSLTAVVVDDASLDGTAAAAEAANRDGRLIVATAPPLIAGWTGKLRAMDHGLAVARREFPDAAFVLFSDADIAYAPAVLRRLVAKAEAEHLDLVSVMAALHSQSLWERLLIPAFVFFFQKLYPFPWVKDRRRQTAAAAGGCMLVRIAALDAAGGLAAIRDLVIDDCALGALLKARGAIWLGLTPDVASLRRYDRLSEIWTMVARSAFAQLDHSTTKLLGTVVGMAIIYLAAPSAIIAGVFLGSSAAIALGLVGLAVMVVCYRPTLAAYGLPEWWGLTLPLAGLLYTGMTIHSAVRHWVGRDTAWKGRRYRPAAPTSRS